MISLRIREQAQEPVTPEVASSSLVVPATTKSRGYVNCVAPFLLSKNSVSTPISNLHGHFQGIATFGTGREMRFIFWENPR